MYPPENINDINDEEVREEGGLVREVEGEQLIDILAMKKILISSL